MEDSINFEELIKKELKKNLDKKFTEYKNEKLKDLNIEIEKQRNKLIQSVLDSVAIIMERETGNYYPTINIQIEKRIVMKGD